MGFWQTGYAEFHELPGLEDFVYSPPPPVVYFCEHCPARFNEEDDLRRHRFERHPLRQPALLMRGRVVGALPLTVLSPLRANDVLVEDTARCFVNGHTVPPAEVGAYLAPMRREFVEVRLTKNEATTRCVLDFRVADESHLVGVESAFLTMARHKVLSIEAVARFIQKCRAFDSAMPYCDGVCHYLYGVMAKERTKDSGLHPNQYAERYLRASDELSGFDRPLARSICSLVAFHFNRFDDAESLALEGAQRHAAGAFAALLQGIPWHFEAAFSPATGSAVDDLLTDQSTVEILHDASQGLLALKERAGDMQAKLSRLAAGYDRLKWVLLTSEALAASDDAGAHAAARRLAREMAAQPDTEGRRRALLRQAFRQAGMSVVQFVHEPLAALYGYLRASQGTEDLVRRYDGKLLLVFDWGGGTLDLTMCRVLDGLLVQIANDGTEEVGGDIFDEELRNEVERRSRAQQGVLEDIGVLPEARKRLLHQCEEAKIRLSDRSTWNVYVDPYYQSEESSDLQVNLSRDDLQDIVGHLVRKGVARIERLLEREGYSTASVELCLATGGMVNMPLVKNRLDELFGPSRVHVSRRSASAIAEGAAWVAHDEARLHLAKNVELALARNSYMPLLVAGEQMPLERENPRKRFSLYCADPSDGHGKFSLVSPHRPGPRVLPDDTRRVLGNMVLKVDAKAEPFRERLELDISINEDLVLKAEAWSLNQNSREETEIHDLEFALATPGAKSGWLRAGLLGGTEVSEVGEPGDLVMRSNLASSKDESLVPGEVMYQHNPAYFWRHTNRPPPQVQDEERLYYKPCAYCKRRQNDPLCQCATSEASRTSSAERPSA